MRWLFLFVILLTYWAVLSFELTTPFLIGSGAVTCALVAWVVLRRGLTPADWTPGAYLRSVFLYIPWLLLQIVLANLRVIRTVWDPRLPIDPRMVEVPCSLRTSTGRATYANSITLTPGTVTIEVAPDRLLVHALTAKDAADLLQGDMETRVRDLEGGAPA